MCSRAASACVASGWSDFDFAADGVWSVTMLFAQQAR
jgi:hypothetical protein